MGSRSICDGIEDSCCVFVPPRPPVSKTKHSPANDIGRAVQLVLSVPTNRLTQWQCRWMPECDSRIAFVETLHEWGDFKYSANWQSAVRQVGNLRYRQLPIGATFRIAFIDPFCVNPRSLFARIMAWTWSQPAPTTWPGGKSRFRSPITACERISGNLGCPFTLANTRLKLSVSLVKQVSSLCLGSNGLGTASLGYSGSS